jgi:cobalt transporter subunit CbtB
MATLTFPVARSQTSTRSILGTALFGALLLFVAGFSQPDALHAATHDTRHATGFPCH